MEKIRIEIKWAVIFMIMTLLWMLLEKLAGLHGKYIDYHLYLTNLFAIPAIWTLVLALKDKKKEYFDGRMSYKQGLISGTIISIFIALLSPLTQWITTNIISPEYFPNLINRSVELGYFKTTEVAKENFNYKTYVIQSVISSLIFGVLTTTITMLWLRTRNK